MGVTPQRLVPKNGKYLVAMMVGGFPDRARELRDGLAQHRGILVQYHVDPQKGPGPLKAPRLPEDLDLLLVITSQMDDGHLGRLGVLTHRWEKEHGGLSVPTIRSEHKWTALSNHLQTRFGISQTPPLPDEVLKAPYFKAPHEKPQGLNPEEFRVPLAAMAHYREPEPEPRLDPKVKFAPAPPAPEPQILPPPASEPVPVPIPPPAGVPVTVQAEQDLRTRFMQMDTLALIRELQARMPLAGVKSMMIFPDEVTIEHTPAQPQAVPAPDERPSLTIVAKP